GWGSRDGLGAVGPDSPGGAIGGAGARVAAEGAGVVVLLHSAESSDAIEEQVREFFNERRGRWSGKNGSGAYMTVGTGSQILRDLGVGKMRLLSAPMKFSALSGFDLEVVEYIPYEPSSS